MINEPMQELIKEAHEDYSKRCEKIGIGAVPYTYFAASVVNYPEFAKACGVSVYTKQEDSRLYMGIHYNGKTVESLLEQVSFPFLNQIK